MPIDIAKFKAETRSRTATFGKVDAEKRTAELSFSSNAELERWPGFVEVLSHEKDAVDMSRLESGASLLFNHDWDTPIGVVESATVDSAEGKGRAIVRFGNSARAKEIFDDVRDGILRGVSVGYRIADMELTAKRDDGKTEVYTAKRWQPYEISIVTVPADVSVGVGRSATHSAISPETQITMSTTAAPATNAAPDIEGARSNATTAERDRVRTIHEMGKQYQESDLARDFAVEGKSVESFREALLEKVSKRNAAVQIANADIGLSDGEVRQFSFLRLLRALSAQPDARAREMEAARFELDACAAAADKIKHRSVKGTVIPMDVLRASAHDGRRDIVSVKTGAGYTGTGGNTIATDLLSGSFFELLSNRTTIMQLGTQLGGLVGKVEIPKQTAGASAYWIGENDVARDTDIRFGLMGLTPKTIAAKGQLTRKMLMQSSLDVEALLRADIAKALAQGIDFAGFYGDGTANAPVGIRNISGINIVNFAALQPTYAELVAMETECEADNIEAQSSVYVHNARLRGHFKTAKKFPTASDTATIWEPGSTLNGYRAEVTNQVANDEVFYGDFSELLIGLWGGLEITVDPYSNSGSGQINIVAMQDIDFNIRRPQAFTFGKKV